MLRKVDDSGRVPLQFTYMDPYGNETVLDVSLTTEETQANPEAYGFRPVTDRGTPFKDGKGVLVGVIEIPAGTARGKPLRMRLNVDFN